MAMLFCTARRGVRNGGVTGLTTPFRTLLARMASGWMLTLNHAMERIVRVRATEEGFYGQFREPGDVFEIEDESQLGGWMTVLDKLASIGNTTDMTPRKRLKLTEQLRLAVETCGRTRYRISKDTGIDETALSRFASGERGLSMATLDRLADYLGLDLVMDGRRMNGGE